MYVEGKGEGRVVSQERVKTLSQLYVTVEVKDVEKVV